MKIRTIFLRKKEHAENVSKNNFFLIKRNVKRNNFKVLTIFYRELQWCIEKKFFLIRIKK